MGKTADLTAVQKAIIDTLKQEGHEVFGYSGVYQNRFSSVFLSPTLIFISTADIRNMLICKVLVKQPADMWQLYGQKASLPCDITSNPNNPINVLWFVFKKDSHHLVDLVNQPKKYELEKHNLNIYSLHANDSGVYHCAAFLTDLACSGAQTIGSGTTLLVREMGMQTAWHVSWVLFVLLTLYSLAVLFLMIRKKTGHNLTVDRGTKSSGNKKNATHRIQFGAVVQELYSKTKSRKLSKQSDDSGPTQKKVKSPRSHHPDEDIYQNL
ncbi:hypothetical protein UPYG_G00104070 [Umbra pygmaea]|uniref:Ig-like domain-containing protein n=1 Tax=Umbra pygmaea TaxID=75934 RepID=A0ABD0X1F5_UMBPY